MMGQQLCCNDYSKTYYTKTFDTKKSVGERVVLTLKLIQVKNSLPIIPVCETSVLILS